MNMTQACQMTLLSMSSHSSVFVWEIMGSIPVGYSEFLSLSHNPHHVDQFTFQSPVRVSLESLSIEYLLVYLDHKWPWFEHLWYCFHVLTQSVQNIQRSANQNQSFVKWFFLGGETTTLKNYSCTALFVSWNCLHVDMVCLENNKTTLISLNLIIHTDLKPPGFISKLLNMFMCAWPFNLDSKHLNFSMIN